MLAYQRQDFYQSPALKGSLLTTETNPALRRRDVMPHQLRIEYPGAIYSEYPADTLSSEVAMTACVNGSLLTIDRNPAQRRRDVMPRQPRIDYPGAKHHVVDRGDQQAAIFEDGQDHIRFLATPGEDCTKHGSQVLRHVPDLHGSCWCGVAPFIILKTAVQITKNSKRFPLHKSVDAMVPQPRIFRRAHA